MPAAPAWTVVDGGVIVVVRLTPKSGRDAIDGVEPQADGKSVLKARVAAPPSEGEANTALLRLLAKSLDMPRRNVTLVAGATARIKRVKLAGDGPSLAAALARLAVVR